jgi:hypothetical protein
LLPSRPSVQPTHREFTHVSFRAPARAARPHYSKERRTAHLADAATKIEGGRVGIVVPTLELGSQLSGSVEDEGVRGKELGLAEGGVLDLGGGREEGSVVVDAYSQRGAGT